MSKDYSKTIKDDDNDKIDLDYWKWTTYRKITLFDSKFVSIRLIQCVHYPLYTLKKEKMDQSKIAYWARKNDKRKQNRGKQKVIEPSMGWGPSSKSVFGTNISSSSCCGCGCGWGCCCCCKNKLIKIIIKNKRIQYRVLGSGAPKERVVSLWIKIELNWKDCYV